LSSKVKGKWIIVDNDIYARLKALGEKGETFSDIIRKLLETYEHMVAPDKEEIESSVNTKSEDPNTSKQDPSSDDA
jgi:predicted CopG family antitoxin